MEPASTKSITPKNPATTCASCNNNLKPEQVGLIQFYCPAGHSFSLCSTACQRSFEKRCVKATQGLANMLNKLKNNGSFQFRQMPRTEREKLMHMKEAENIGAMNCPFDIKSLEKAHPHCSLVLKCINKSKDGDPEQESTTASSTDGTPIDHVQQTREAAETVLSPEKQGSGELLDDDKLVMLQPVEEEQEEILVATKKKKKEKESEKADKKKKQVLDIDVKFAPRDSNSWDGSAGQSAPSAKAAPAAPPSWAKVVETHQAQPPSWAKDPEELAAPPPNAHELVWGLVELTACSEAQAFKLLRSHSWNMEASADAFFSWSVKSASESQNVPAEFFQQLAELPSELFQQPAESPVPTESGSFSKSTQANPSGYPDRYGSEPSTTNNLPEPSTTNNLPDNWEAVWSPTDNLYYFWNTITGQTQWEIPDSPSKVAEVFSDSSSKAAEVFSDSPSKAAEVLAPQHDLTSALSQAGTFKNLPAVYLCSRTWEPDAAFPSAMRILHGERLRVSWTDSERDGWAYGSILGEDEKEGYFPQQMLTLATREPQALVVGRRYFVGEHFQGPPDDGGYLTVAPQSLIEVVHQESDVGTWCYAKLIDLDGSGACSYGWIPESILCDSFAAEPQ